MTCNANLMIYSKLGVGHLTFEVVVVGLVKTRHDFFKKSFIALGIFFLGMWVCMIFFLDHVTRFIR